MPGKQPTVSTDRKTAFHSGVANLATPPTAGRGADQKNGRQPEGAARSKLTMLHKPNVPDQQGVRDFGDRELRIIKVTDHFSPVIDGTPFDGKPVKVI